MPERSITKDSERLGKNFKREFSEMEGVNPFAAMLPYLYHIRKSKLMCFFP